jgi:hypothetical protein
MGKSWGILHFFKTKPMLSYKAFLVNLLGAKNFAYLLIHRLWILISYINFNMSTFEIEPDAELLLDEFP